jgi:ATP-dependent RNA helicase RhlE
LSLLPTQRQNLLFSATFSPEIKSLAQGLLKQPVLIEVARRQSSAELIAQQVYRVSRERKPDLLVHLIKQYNWYQVLVFTRTKHGADRLSKHLTKEGIPALAIHGNKSQSVRTKTLAQFKDGALQVLVATDIAARGIDINELPQVINFDLPDVPEDYVHRIGRTGRAGAEGSAFSLVCGDEVKLLTAIERLMKRSIDQEVVTGFEPGPHTASSDRPPERGQQRRTRSSGAVARSQPKLKSEPGERSQPPPTPRSTPAKRRHRENPNSHR